MNRGGLYLAVYDVTEDRERTKVANIFERYGIRIQKSAFEVRLAKGHRSRLLSELKALHLESGWVALYRVDEGARRHTVGYVPENPFAEEHHGYVL